MCRTPISLSPRFPSAPLGVSRFSGWEASELRAKMNSGEIWNLMPSDFQSKVKAVRKLTNNVGGGDANRNAAVTATSDRLFLLSYSEIVETPYSGWSGYSWIGNEGIQYEAFNGKVKNGSYNSCLSIGHRWWKRMSWPDSTDFFSFVGDKGSLFYYDRAATLYYICPAWCF